MLKVVKRKALYVVINRPVVAKGSDIVALGIVLSTTGQ